MTSAHERGDAGDQVHAAAAADADGAGEPKVDRRGQALRHVAGPDDCARGEEAQRLRQGLEDAQDLAGVGGTVRRHQVQAGDRDEGGTEGHQRMSAQARTLAPDLAAGSQHHAAQEGRPQPQQVLAVGGAQRLEHAARSAGGRYSASAFSSCARLIRERPGMPRALACS